MKDFEPDILFLLTYLNRILKKDLDERLKDDNLTATQGRIIFFIASIEYENGYCTQIDIIKRFSLSKSTVSELVSRLESKGYLVKENIDNRCCLKLTETSRGLIRAFESNRKHTNELLTEGLSEKELEAIKIHLRKMIANLKGDDNICGSK